MRVTGPAGFRRVVRCGRAVSRAARPGGAAHRGPAAGRLRRTARPARPRRARGSPRRRHRQRLLERPRHREVALQEGGDDPVLLLPGHLLQPAVVEAEGVDRALLEQPRQVRQGGLPVDVHVAVTDPAPADPAGEIAAADGQGDRRDVGGRAEDRAGGAGQLGGEVLGALGQQRAGQRVGRVAEGVGGVPAELPPDQGPGVLLRRHVLVVVSGHRPRRNHPGIEIDRRPAISPEELFGPDRPPQEHVVIEIEEMLGKARNSVQLRFDRMRVEHRENRRVLEQIAVRDHGQIRMPGHQPVGLLPVGDQEDVPDPRGVHGDGPQAIAQLIAVVEALGAVPGGGRLGQRGQRGGPPAPPDRVAVVDPGDHRVDRKGDVVQQRPGERGRHREFPTADPHRRVRPQRGHPPAERRLVNRGDGPLGRGGGIPEIQVAAVFRTVGEGPAAGHHRPVDPHPLDQHHRRRLRLGQRGLLLPRLLLRLLPCLLLRRLFGHRLQGRDGLRQLLGEHRPERDVVPQQVGVDRLVAEGGGEGGEHLGPLSGRDHHPLPELLPADRGELDPARLQQVGRLGEAAQEGIAGEQVVAHLGHQAVVLPDQCGQQLQQLLLTLPAQFLGARRSRLECGLRLPGAALGRLLGRPLLGQQS